MKSAHVEQRIVWGRVWGTSTFSYCEELKDGTLIPLPEALNHNSLRFEMKTEADWDRAHSFLEAAGDDLSWQRLAQLAERNFSVR